MASKRQRRQAVGGKRKQKRSKKIHTPSNIARAKNGLVSDPNADLAPKLKRQAVRHVEWVAAEPPPNKIRTLSEFDTAYITALVNKYGQDFDKMARDRKLNRDQLTPTNLQKMWRKLNEDSASATSADAPEGSGGD